MSSVTKASGDAPGDRAAARQLDIAIAQRDDPGLGIVAVLDRMKVRDSPRPDDAYADWLSGHETLSFFSSSAVTDITIAPSSAEAGVVDAHGGPRYADGGDHPAVVVEDRPRDAAYSLANSSSSTA